MPDEPQHIVVDTNCYVRLYYSDVRPILGGIVGNHKLVTLRELAREAEDGTPLVERNAWLLTDDIQNDIRNGVLNIPAEDVDFLRQSTSDYRNLGDQVLRRYCAEHRREPVRILSNADAKALAVAAHYGYVLATDEWPLRVVCQHFDEQDGEGPVLISSVGLLKLLEDGGHINAQQREGVLREWMRAGEWLRHWNDEHLQLFGTAAPVVQ